MSGELQFPFTSSPSPSDIPNQSTSNPIGSPESLQSLTLPDLPIKNTTSQHLVAEAYSTGAKHVAQVVLAGEIDGQAYHGQDLDSELTLPILPRDIYVDYTRYRIDGEEDNDNNEIDVPEPYERPHTPTPFGRLSGNHNPFSDEHATVHGYDKGLSPPALPWLKKPSSIYSSAPTTKTSTNPFKRYRPTVASPLNCVVLDTSPERNKRDRSSLFSQSSLEIPFYLENSSSAQPLARETPIDTTNISPRVPYSSQQPYCYSNFDTPTTESFASERSLHTREDSISSLATSSTKKLLLHKPTRSLQSEVRLKETAKLSSQQLADERLRDDFLRSYPAVAASTSRLHRVFSSNPLINSKEDPVPSLVNNVCFWLALVIVALGLVLVAGSFGWLLSDKKDGAGVSTGTIFFLLCSIVVLVIGVIWTAIVVGKKVGCCLGTQRRLGLHEKLDLEHQQGQSLLFLGVGEEYEGSTLGGGSLKEPVAQGRNDHASKDPIWKRLYRTPPSPPSQTLSKSIYHNHINEDDDPDIGLQRLMPIPPIPPRNPDRLAHDELCSARHWTEGRDRSLGMNDSDDIELEDMSPFLFVIGEEEED